MSTLKVGAMMIALTAIFVLIGRLVGGPTGMVIALVLAVVMNVGSFWFSDKLVLKMTRAQPLSEAEAPELHAMLDRLVARANMPKPGLYLVNDPSPNAFATGRNPEKGIVAVNTGLLDLLEPREVEGVIAHELAHIKHRDTLTMAVVASVAGAIMTLANFAQIAAIFGFGGNDEESGGNPIVLLAVAMIAPLAAMMVQMGISRAREFEADRLGAEIAGSSEGLASALQKLEQGVAMRPSRTLQPSAAHMAIINPFTGIGSFTANLFRTHPPTAQRIEKLRALEITR